MDDMRSIAVDLPVRSRQEADEGYRDGHGWHLWLRCLVDPDGSVWAWDRIAGHYTRTHDLTDEQIQQARQMAEGGRHAD